MSKTQEYYFKEGCFIEEWQNTSVQPELSIARVRVDAKTQTRLHALKDTTERYVILSGTGTVTVADKSWPVGEGDVVLIEPSQSQKIHNSAEQDLMFLAICTPRFQEKNYIEIEEHE